MGLVSVRALESPCHLGGAARSASAPGPPQARVTDLDYGLVESASESAGTIAVMDLLDLPTPALVIDLEALNFNIDKMAAVRPGPALRSHVKAFKSTELARHLAQRSGSDTFCCATILRAILVLGSPTEKEVEVPNI